MVIRLRTDVASLVTYTVSLLALLLIRPSTSFVFVTTHTSSLTAFLSRATLATTSSQQRRIHTSSLPKMALKEIQVTPQATEEQINKLGARDWPTWSCDVSKFPWEYEGTETCLILEGDVTVTPDDARQAVTVRAGDICVFPDGMKCTWDVRVAIKKHYKFE